jgi:hypothetical protein
VLLVNLASILLGFAMFANMLVTTQLLQRPVSSGYGLGLDMLHTGLWMAPSALAFGAMAPVAAAVTRRFGPQTTLLAGALAMTATYVARVSSATSLAGRCRLGTRQDGHVDDYAAPDLIIARCRSPRPRHQRSQRSCGRSASSSVPRWWNHRDRRRQRQGETF